MKLLCFVVCLFVVYHQTTARPSDPVTNTFISGQQYNHDYNNNNYMSDRNNRAYGGGDDSTSGNSAAGGVPMRYDNNRNYNRNYDSDNNRNYNRNYDSNSNRNYNRNRNNRYGSDDGNIDDYDFNSYRQNRPNVGGITDNVPADEDSDIIPGISRHWSKMGSHNRNEHGHETPLPLPVDNSNGRNNNGPVNRLPSPTNYRPMQGEKNPGDSDQTGGIVKPAFKGCERHENTHSSQLVDNHHETIPVPMKDNSRIALYPLTDNNDAMYLIILMPSMQFKAKIQGTIIDLMQCSETGDNCEELDTRSVKSKNLLTSQEWNYIDVNLSKNQISIDIGMTVEAMAITNIPEEDLENAEWFVSTSDGSYRNNGGANDEEGDSFLVQYPCAEYIANYLTTPQPPITINLRTDFPASITTQQPYEPGVTAAVIGNTTDVTEMLTTKEDEYISAVVVGVIVTLLLVLVITTIAVSMYRKRSSMQMTESTPLSEQKTPQNSGQENEFQVQK